MTTSVTHPLLRLPQIDPLSVPPEDAQPQAPDAQRPMTDAFVDAKAPGLRPASARPTATPKPSTGTDPKKEARALAAWKALERSFGVPGHAGELSKYPHGDQPAAVWQFGQAIAAALDMAKLTHNYAPVNRLFAELHQQYKDPQTRGYFPEKGGTARWYDDNGWVGLDFMQAWSQTKDPSYLHKAEELFKFVQHGQLPHGGMRWSTRPKDAGAFNMPATASTAQMALELYQATGRREYLTFAEKNIHFMNKRFLIQSGPDAGLYWEGVIQTKNGAWKPWAYGKPAKLNSYNQGTAVMCNLLLGQILAKQGEHSLAQAHLQQAKATVGASLTYFKGNKLWQDQAAFNGIYFRNLLAYAQATHDPRCQQALEHYLDEAWNRGRDAHGIFDQNGIGLFNDKPGHGDVLDQAALVQLFALDALQSRKKH